MTNISAHNKNLEQWIQRLDNTRLPVYKVQRERALEALHNTNNSLRDIAQTISEAPTIAFILMRAANRSSSRLVEPVQTLENALSRLGLERCGRLLKSLIDDQESDIPFALRQVWLIGQHLNIQAHGLFSLRMARLWGEIHWGSLLFLSPSWPLLARHPEFFIEWEQRVLGNNEPAAKVERELIGMPLTELCLGLAEHWKLPSWIIEGYRLLNNNPQMLVQALAIARHTNQPLLQQKKLDESPALNSWLNRPANTLVFTCGLVMAAHSSWGNEQCVRWQRLISLYLKQDLASVQQNIHQLAVKHARLQQQHDLWQPAQALLWPWSAQRLRTKNNQAEAQRADTQTPLPAAKLPPPNGADLGLWQAQCITLQASPSPFLNAVQLLQHVSLALQACGLTRLCIMLLEQSTQRIKVSHVHGIAKDQLPSSFAQLDNELTQRLMSAPLHLIVTHSNAADIQPQLPPELVELFNAKEWLLASLANNNKVVMLIAADQSSDTLHPVTVQAFKKTVGYIQAALALFSQRTR